jgi:acetyl esterase/lipase
MKYKIFFLAILSLVQQANAQFTPHPGQPIQGPGGIEHYKHQDLVMVDCAEEAEGFWLFEPDAPRPDEAPVIVFMHGYGAYNPMVYGKWIKHLVAQGNIVIYPRYQLNLVNPKTDKFPETASVGIRDAIEELQNNGHVKPNLDKVVYIGHSYGGTICAWIGVHWEGMQVPKPAAIFLAQPGTGPLTGVTLEDYSGMAADINLIALAGSEDYVVADKLARRVFETAIHTPMRNFLMHYPDTSDAIGILGSHHEAYCLDYDLDNGVRNYTALRTMRTSRLDAVDFNCYWKLADALIYYTRDGLYKEYAFGNTEQQRFMGLNASGKPYRPMDVWVPGNGD